MPGSQAQKAASSRWSRPPMLPTLSLVATLLVAIILLAMPWSKAADPLPAATPSPRIADVWPAAKIVTIPGVLPDGSTYEPLLFSDERSSVGLATDLSPSGATSALVTVIGDQVRVLRDYGDNPARVTAVMEGADLFWLESKAEPDGGSRTSVWRSSMTGGTPAKLAADAGNIVVGESPDDLALADGRLHWMARTPDGQSTELHSVDTAGGTVTVRPLGADFILRDWPWAALPAPGGMGQLTLRNLQTGQTVDVVGTQDQVLDCTSQWCEVSTMFNGGSNVEHALMRPDGSAYRLLSRDDGRYPVGPTPILGRFAVQGQAAPQEWQPDRLWLLDVVGGRTALASANYTLQFGSSGTYIWWSSGDNEALQWNLLDLRQLMG